MNNSQKSSNFELPKISNSMLSVDIFGVARSNQRQKRQNKVKENIIASYDLSTKSKYILPSLTVDRTIQIDSEHKDLVLKPLGVYYDDILNRSIPIDERGHMCMMQKKSEVIYNKKNVTHQNRQVKKPKKVNYSDFLHIIPRVGNLGYNQVGKTSDNNLEQVKSGNYCLYVESKPIIKAENVDELAQFVYRVTNFGTETVAIDDLKICIEFCEHIYQQNELKYQLKNLKSEKSDQSKIDLMPNKEKSVTTTSLIMKMVNVENESLNNQTKIKEWIKSAQNENMIRQRLLLFIRDSTSKDAQGLKDVILELDQEKNGFLFMCDVFKYFDDEFYNRWFVNNQQKIIEAEGLPNPDLSLDENIQFITFKNFIRIFQKFRNDEYKKDYDKKSTKNINNEADTLIEMTITELKNQYDFSEKCDIAEFKHQGSGIQIGKNDS